MQIVHEAEKEELICVEPSVTEEKGYNTDTSMVRKNPDRVFNNMNRYNWEGEKEGKERERGKRRVGGKRAGQGGRGE